MTRPLKFRLTLKGKVVGYERITPDEDGYLHSSWNPDLVGGWVLTTLPRHDNKDAFTGLLDKNGKEIYEGDIAHMNGRNWEVSWDSYFGNWQLGSPIEGVPYWRLGENNENAEIIGNIYENSDLLP